MSKFWNFIKNQTEDNKVELRIEGEIVSSDESWIYEWYGIKATEPNKFRNELNNYKGQEITLWIDSNGGDVLASAGIYNALKEHTGKVTAKVTKAMSAASLIAMAADEILMSPLGIMMIHNPLTGVEGDSRDLRKTAEVLDMVKETIINAYESKTKRSRGDISSMMDKETWMSADVAVKEGFADSVLYQENTDTTKVMNLAYNRLAIVNSANKALKTLIDFEDKSKQPEIIENGGEEMSIKNSVDFKNQHPDIHNEVYNSGNTEGIKAERERLKAFDILNGKVDPVFLNEKKYKDGVTAESVLFKAMQEGKLINATSEFIQNTLIDAKNVNEVPGSTSDEDIDEEAGILNFVKNTASKTLGRGGK